MRLTLSDINGNAVATRDFGARDYLGNAPTQAELRSGQSASIAMDIVESGPRSVASASDLLAAAPSVGRRAYHWPARRWRARLPVPARRRRACPPRHPPSTPPR